MSTTLVSDRLRKMRKQKNLTLAEVAKYLGVQEATVQRYESGQIKTIKHDVIYKLAQLYQCDPQFLLGWGGDSPVTSNSKNNQNNKNSNNQTIANSTVINGDNSSVSILHSLDGSLELTDQAVALVRVFNSMNVKGQTLLLARAYELEDLYNKKEDDE